MATITDTSTGAKTVSPSAGRLFSGKVVSVKMAKTIVVRVDRYVPHPKYKKFERHYKNYKVHDEAGMAHLGDRVEVRGSRPYSKDKHFVLVRVVSAAPVRTSENE